MVARYEDVWVALSKALNTKVHVDEYKMRIYSSLLTRVGTDRFSTQFHISPEAPALAGFMCGNSPHPGCLTRDENVRLHSCEKGNYCSKIRENPVVWIQPIIAHMSNGDDLYEVGVGGGADDLEREAELEFPTAEDLTTLIQV
jgi:DNA cross-link repair 1C protein